MDERIAGDPRFGRPGSAGHRSLRRLWVYYHIDYDAFAELGEGLGRFHASWRRECPTDGVDQGTQTNGEFLFEGANLTGDGNYTILDTTGRGHYVGCVLKDQLVGQWWAHQLDLGHLLPADHVRTALRSVVRHNLRRGFDGWEHTQRVYADADDTGPLMCTWPAGGRPEVATRYCDEVWSGVEYEVAAHCLLEGLEEEGAAILAGLWSRHDGRRRNPFNEIECGDHYVRSMAGWSVLEARSGQVWDATTRTLRISDPGHDGGWWPVVIDTGWGRAVNDGGAIRLEAWHGELDVAELVIGPRAGVPVDRHPRSGHVG